MKNHVMASGTDRISIELMDAAHADDWDSFLLQSRRGQPLQLSTWLRSFVPYGVKPTILVAQTNTGKIVAGIGILRFGKWPLFWATSPSGPVAETGFEDVLPELLRVAKDLTSKQGASIFEFRLPMATDPLPWLLPSGCHTGQLKTHLGSKVTVGAGARQLFWIEFKRGWGNDWEQNLLSTFSASTRRNIKKSLNNDLEACLASTEVELHDAFKIIERNGHEKGYTTRRWKDFGPTVVEQIQKDQAVVLTVKHRNELLGTHYAMLGGRRYTYSMGGTVRTDPDLRVGHFAHWSAIKKAYEMELDGYDFASGGTENVKRFKYGFRPALIEFTPAEYVVNSKIGATVLSSVIPFLQKHKGILNRMLSSLRQR